MRINRHILFCCGVIVPGLLHGEIAMFKNFPLLAEKIAYVSLSDLPTTVMRMSQLGTELGCTSLYIKRDDLSGKILEDGHRLFGGNKIRKLEFLLGDALAQNAQSVLTFGPIGSNHITATAACAQYLGLKSYSMLWASQPNSHVVRRNLALMDYYGTEIHYCPDSFKYSLAATYNYFLENFSRQYLYMIPMGGSCTLGELGFVNAAFELKEQIEQGIIPEPDRLYLSACSYGTISGLLLGAKLAGLKTQIIGIAAAPEKVQGKGKKTIVELFRETNTFLHNLDASIPLFDFTENGINLLFDYAGERYGLLTEQASDAIALMRTKESINLDATYTGKAMAGMIDDIKKNAKPDEVILFWNTFYGDMRCDVTNDFDYKKLPKDLHAIFQEPVQELDAE